MTEAPAEAKKTTTEVAVRDPELDRLARLGKWLAFSESGDKTPAARGAAAALRLFYAQELGLPPMAAAELSVIEGKLVMRALLYRGLAEGAGYRVERTEITDTSCTATLYVTKLGREQKLGSSTFTIEDARRAGLIRDRSAWKTYPQRMLWARASAFVIRDYAPGVAVGIITREELEEGVIDAEYTEVQNEPATPEPGLDQSSEFDAAEQLAAEEAAAEAEQLAAEQEQDIADQVAEAAAGEADLEPSAEGEA
jgi:hypothetical protein